MYNFCSKTFSEKKKQSAKGIILCGNFIDSNPFREELTQSGNLALNLRSAFIVVCQSKSWNSFGTRDTIVERASMSLRGDLGECSLLLGYIRRRLGCMLYCCKLEKVTIQGAIHKAHSKNTPLAFSDNIDCSTKNNDNSFF